MNLSSRPLLDCIPLNARDAGLFVVPPATAADVRPTHARLAAGPGLSEPPSAGTAAARDAGLFVSMIHPATAADLRPTHARTAAAPGLPEPPSAGPADAVIPLFQRPDAEAPLAGRRCETLSLKGCRT